jgi:hypothetical protein
MAFLFGEMEQRGETWNGGVGLAGEAVEAAAGGKVVSVISDALPATRWVLRSTKQSRKWGAASKLAENLATRSWPSASIEKAIARHAGEKYTTWVT